jgi:hypothetical protein
VVSAETSVNQCPNRALDLWATDDVTTATSWANPPTERSLVGSIGSSPYCPAPYLGWDGTGALQSAVTAGRSTLTVEFRVPESQEGDVAFGRRLTAGVRIYVNDDAAPDTPSRLDSDGQGCATRAPYPYQSGLLTFTLYATLTDPDTNDILDARFAIWPVDHPDQRSELGYDSTPSGLRAQVRLPEGFLADGVAYAWSVRADDGILTSDWAAPCYFTVDLVSPSAPTVTSTDYPNDGQMHGRAGIPGLFTFGASGSPDVARYLYSWYPSMPQSVNAPQLGGDVTVSLTPPGGGSNTLVVESVDRAGLMSQPTTYNVFVGWPPPGPTVSVVWPVPHTPGPTTSGTFTFRSTTTGVVSYEYWVDNGDHHTVAAAADGSGQAVVAAGDLGYHVLHVRGVTGDGAVSATTDQAYLVDDAPLVSSTDYPEMGNGGGAGIPGTFTFAPKSAGVVGYLYMFNWGDTYTVAAGADGTASVTWTPDANGFMEIEVFAQYADGTYSQDYDYDFNVGA